VTIFASKTLGEHLARGALGLGAVGLAVSDPMIAMPAWLDMTGRVLLGIGAIVLLRGCPMCWLQGLVETIVARASGRAARASCADGSCAAPRDERY